MSEQHLEKRRDFHVKATENVQFAHATLISACALVLGAQMTEKGPRDDIDTAANGMEEMADRSADSGAKSIEITSSKSALTRDMRVSRAPIDV